MVDVTNITDTAATVFRDNDSPGSSAPHEPVKSAIRDLFGDVGEAISLAMEAGSGAFIIKSTVAALEADLAHDAGVYARVINDDQSPPENGYYLKSGASGAGSWAFVTEDPAVIAAEEADEARDEAVAAVEAVSGFSETIQAPRLISLGDSIIAVNVSGGTAENIGSSPRGEVAWAAAIWPYFEWSTWWVNDTASANRYGSIIGYPGETAVDILDNFDRVLDQAPDVVFISLGGNDIEGGAAAAVPFAAIQSMCEQARGIGAKVLLGNIRPRSGWTVGSAKFIQKEALNVLIADYCADGNAALVDLHSSYADGTGMPDTGKLYDGTHPTVFGASGAAAEALVPVLKRVIKPLFKDQPRTPNVVLNADFSASGGTAGTGVTGVVAGEWAVNCTNCTAVGSLVADGQQLVIDPTSGTFAAAVVSNALINVTEGDWMRAFLDFRISDWDFWRQIEVLVTQKPSDPGSSAAFGFDGAVAEVIDTGGGELILRAQTPPFEILAGVTSVTTQIRIWTNGAGTGTGTIVLQEAYLATVPDPRPLHNF